MLQLLKSAASRKQLIGNMLRMARCTMCTCAIGLLRNSDLNIFIMLAAGCALPVEMFFPGADFPAPALEAALATLGVSCRRLPSEADTGRLHSPDANPKPVTGALARKRMAKGARRQAPAPRHEEGLLRGARPGSARAAASAPAGSPGGRTGGPAPDDDMAGFAMKVAALILSQFEEARALHACL